MPSGKQSRRLRRAEAASPTPARGVPTRVLGAAALAVVALVVGVVLGTGRHGSPHHAALVGATDVRQLLQGIPQRGNVLGRASAPVTMVLYADLQCPYCRLFETEAMPGVVSRYVRPGKLKLELRTLAFVGPDSVRGRVAAIAAARQNKLFDLAQLLYLNQGAENTGWLSAGTVEAAAAGVDGLDVRRLLRESDSPIVDGSARRLDAQAAADGVSGTPTILVGKTGRALHQVPLSSPSDAGAVTAAVAAALG